LYAVLGAGLSGSSSQGHTDLAAGTVWLYDPSVTTTTTNSTRKQANAGSNNKWVSILNTTGAIEFGAQGFVASFASSADFTRVV
jgi:hypothetical protein